MTQTEFAESLKEIASRLDVPESTLRLYRDEFDELIPTLGSGRRRRYAEDGAEALRQIVAWRREGWGSGLIRDALLRERQPRERTRRRNADERLDEIAARLLAQAAEIAMLRVEVGALRADIRRLTEILRTDQAPSLEDVLTRHDE